MHGIAIRYVQHFQAVLERGVCELAHFKKNGHIIYNKIINIRAFILHLSISCDKIKVKTDLSLSPSPSLELAIISGICVSQTHLGLFGFFSKV